jgi:hypothetical protein
VVEASVWLSKMQNHIIHRCRRQSKRPDPFDFSECGL